MHLYLSVGLSDGNGGYVEPKTGKPNTMMRYRGEATGQDDDPQSYKRMMERAGHLVELHTTIVGSINPQSGHIEYPIGTKF